MESRPAYWNRLPDEIKGQIYTYLTKRDVRLLLLAYPQDAHEAQRFFGVDSRLWEQRTCAHAWLSQAAQEASTLVLQRPRPCTLPGSAGLSGKQAFRYVYAQEQDVQCRALALLRDYLAADKEDEVSIPLDVDNASIERLRRNYRALSQSLAQARGEHTRPVDDALRTYAMRAAPLVGLGVGLHLAGVADGTQPTLWLCGIALLMCAGIGLDAQPAPGV